MAQRQDFRRIGLLLPSSNTVQEADLVRMLPPATTVHTTRLTLTTVDQESTLAIVAELERESLKAPGRGRRCHLVCRDRTIVAQRRRV